MSLEQDFAQAKAKLKAALDSEAFPAAQVERGVALLRRLSAPVRLTFFGMPRSGKTELINLLVGERILPAITSTPTTELVWGPQAKCRVVSADGSDQHFDWPVADGFDWSDAVFLKVEHPNPILKSMTCLEIVTDGSPQDLSNALNWAIPRTDISLWCTQEFNRIEHALWTQVPEVMKDHGFLVVTRADELGVAGTLPETLKRLTGVVDDEFQQLFAVATPQFLGAMAADGTVPPQVRSATGGGAIVDTIKVHVDRGRRADLDGAEVFLARFGVSDIEVKIGKPKEIAKPESTQMAARAKSDLPEADTQSQTPLDGKPRPLAEAHVYFQGQTQKISRFADDDGEIAEHVLGACAEAMENLVDLVSQSGESSVLTDEIEEAHEMLVLMQLEGGESSAADAATVVLQVARELELAQAA